MTKATTAATASISKVKSSTNINKKYDPCQAKPYNRYNIFYILERERLLQSNSNYKRKTVPPPSNFFTGYELLDMPALPPRYEHLDLPYGWYMPGKRKAIKKRDHTKSHGLASFKDIARHVADEYRNIDKVTLEYVTAVAEVLKQRQGELKAARRRELEHIAEMNALASTSSIPTSSSSITNRVDACCDKKTKLAIEQYSTSAQSLPFVCGLSVPSLPKLSISDLSTKTTTAATASVSKVKSSTNINKKYDPCQAKPYNRYNIFYILERERLLQSNSNYRRKTVPPPSNFFTGYELLEMPALPPRYEHLDLPSDWYMPGKRKAKKRDHTKSHGLASFKDIARHVADEYRNIDKVTLEYVTAVAEVLKQRQGELKAARRRELEHIAEMNALASTSSIPTSSSSITNRVDACCDKKTKLAIEQYSTSVQSRPFVCGLSVPSLPKLSISDLSTKTTTAATASISKVKSSTNVDKKYDPCQTNARHVADEYRNIDKVTLEYTTAVAEVLKQRQGELKAARRRELEHLAEMNALASTSSIPTSSSSITNRVDACCDKTTKLAIEQYSTSAQSRPFVCGLSVAALRKLSIFDLYARSASAVNLKAAARFLSSTSSGVRIPNDCVYASQVNPTQRKFT